MKKLFAILCAILLLAGCSDNDGTLNGSGDDRSDRVRDGGSTPKATMPNQDPGQDAPVPPASSYPNISGHGVLWKPVSDSDGKLAVLLARSYGNPPVQVLSMTGSIIETGRFVYFSNPDRATYRFGRAGGSFPKPCLVRAGSKTFTIPDGSRRYE